MRQRLTFIAVEQDNVSGFGLLFAQLQTQADPFHLGDDLATLQRVPRSPPTELFLCNALHNCARLMRTPSRPPTSAPSPGIVPLRPAAPRCSSNGITTG